VSYLKSNKLIKNFSYLSVIELANYVLPFVTIPYIVHTVGVEKFGIITFAYAIMAYFQLLVMFGFRLTGTKYISLHRHDQEKISSFYWNVITIQLILFLISILLFLPLFLMDSIHNEWQVFILSFGLVIGSILFPIWFFQGMEDMKYVAILNVISKSIYSLSIFLLIKIQSDYIFIPVLNVFSVIFIGIMSNIVIKSKYNIKFIFPSFAKIELIVKDNWHIFLSTITTNLYTTTNTVLLGFLTNYSVVGIYSIASTIHNGIVKIIKIYTVTIYPHLAQYGDNIPLLETQAKKYLLLYIKILIGTAFLTFAFSDIMIHTMFGNAAQESSTILKLLAISILVEPLGGFFTSYLAIKNQYKTITKITFTTMLSNYLFALPLMIAFHGVGLAVSRILTESVQVYLNAKYCKEIVSKNISSREKE
jgi:PST family polysaccharide transporter